MGIADAFETLHEVRESRSGASVVTQRLLDVFERLHEAPSSHDDGWHHPSSIARSPHPFFCERSLALQAHYPGSREEFSSTLEFVWKIGTAVHDIVQDLLGKARVLWGKWRCKKCKAVTSGFRPRYQCPCSASCEENCIWPMGFESRECGLCPLGVQYDYMEHEVESREYLVRGHFDGLLRLERDSLLEIKTINTREFGFLQRPKPEHVLQARIYDLLGPRTENIVMLYIDKGGNDPPKEFKVEQDNAEVMALLRRLKRYNRERESGKLFLRVSSCTSTSCPRAKRCPVAQHCFSEGVEKKFGVVDPL